MVEQHRVGDVHRSRPFDVDTPLITGRLVNLKRCVLKISGPKIMDIVGKAIRLIAGVGILEEQFDGSGLV